MFIISAGSSGLGETSGPSVLPKLSSLIFLEYAQSVKALSAICLNRRVEKWMLVLMIFDV